MPVDDLLRQHPELWRAREPVGAGPACGLPTGFTALDRCLPGGGWPSQGLIEILLDRHGIGELSLLMPALATLCGTGDDDDARCASRHVAHDGSGGWLAWVSPPYQPYAPALAAAGIDVQRVLVVRSANPAEWAMEQALRSEACSAVLGWAAPRDLHSLRRLQLAAEQARCLAVLFRPAGAVTIASPARLRLALRPSGEGGLELRILKSRGGCPATLTLPRAH